MPSIFKSVTPKVLGYLYYCWKWMLDVDYLLLHAIITSFKLVAQATWSKFQWFSILAGQL